MNVYYRQCLYVCKALHDSRRTSYRRRQRTHSTGSPVTPPPISPPYGVDDIAHMANSTVADHLLYAHVMEMCQSAATDELFGMTNEVGRVLGMRIIK